MKTFIIRIQGHEKSEASAQRCKKSILAFDPYVDVHMFDAYYGSAKNLEAQAKKKEFHSLDKLKERYSRYERCLGAFLSHFHLWSACTELDEPILILEHDAVCVAPINFNANFQGLLSIGHPSYGKWNTPEIMGVNKLTSKRYLPGAHAYMINPKAARIIIQQAKACPCPVDVFLNAENFPWLEEYYPWPVIANDSFTTIQAKDGCLAKHNYSGDYEII